MALISKVLVLFKVQPGHSHVKCKLIISAVFISGFIFKFSNTYTNGV